MSHTELSRVQCSLLITKYLPIPVSEYNLDFPEDEDDHHILPSWVDVTPTPVNLRDDEGWDRDNTGEYITVVNARTLKVECPYNNHMGTEGAIWSYGLTRGHHVFAVMWPRDQRIFYEAHVSLQTLYLTSSKLLNIYLRSYVRI
jgi:hypothetical protein